MVKIEKGEIVIVNLEPIKGSEQGGIRPCLIIQNDLANKYSPTTIIVAITSKKFDKEYPTNLQLDKKESKLDKDSTILFNQIRTIDKSRIIKKVTKLPPETMRNVNKILKLSLDLD